jgi:hypothetical protein
VTFEEKIIEVLKENGGTMPYGALRRAVKKLDKHFDFVTADITIFKLLKEKRVRLSPGTVSLRDDPDPAQAT